MPVFAVLSKKPINGTVYNVVTNVVVAESIDDLDSSDVVIEDNKANPAGIGRIYDAELDDFLFAPEEV